MTEDTYEGQINNPLSLNLYTYVNNNPLTNWDPTGHWCESADGKYSRPGGCNGGIEGEENVNHDVNGSIWSPDVEHDGDSILDNNNEYGTYYYNVHNDAISEDNGWGGFAFDTAVTLGYGAARSGLKLVGSKIGGLFAREAAITKELSFIGGKAGEAYLAKSLGAVSEDQLQVSMSTSLGIRRIDVLVEGIAHESKVGYVKYSQSVIKQIEKDAELIAKGKIDGATWNFYKSGVTGQIGADQRILDLLTKYGIGYIIH
jgi:hypothetical protein